MGKSRPYWHVDAKWITGIICLFILSSFFLNLTLWRITSKEIAIPLMGKTIAYMYSRNGLDDQAEIDKFKQKIAESPTGKLQPIQTVNVYVSLSDIEGKSPREVRLWLFNQVAEPIWIQKDIDKPMEKFGILGLLSQRTNNILFWIMVGHIIALLAFGALFIRFSAGFGRVFGPGLLLFLSSILNAPFWGFATIIAPKVRLSKMPFMEEGSAEMAKQLSGALRFILPDVTKLFLFTYLWALSLGIALMIIAGVGKVIFRFRKKKEMQKR